MKTLIHLTFAILGSFASLAYAQSQELPAPSFPVIQAHMDAYHFSETLVNGKMTLNYPANKVELSLNGEPSLQFEMTTTSVGACGVTVIKATRINDDIVDEVEVHDNSTMICRMYLPYQASLTWKTYSAFSTTKNVAISEISFGRAQ